MSVQPSPSGAADLKARDEQIAKLADIAKRQGIVLEAITNYIADLQNKKILPKPEQKDKK